MFTIKMYLDVNIWCKNLDVNIWLLYILKTRLNKIWLNSYLNLVLQK